MPGVPAMTVAIPRAAHRRMSAPHGTPATATSRPSSAPSAPRTSAGKGCAGSVSPEANCPPGHDSVASGQAAATTASTAARAAAGSSPTRTGARPSKRRRSGTLLDHSPASTRPTSSG
jgi:hypothetical protein